MLSICKYHLFGLLLLVALINAKHKHCEKAPTETMRIVCEQLHRWDDNVREWDRNSRPIETPGSESTLRGAAGRSGQAAGGGFSAAAGEVAAEADLPSPPPSSGADNESSTIMPIQPVAPQVAQLSWTLYQCMDLQCVCPYLNGRLAANGACTLPNGQLLGKSLRKEYRQLSEDERTRLHNAFWEIKHSGLYDHLAQIHRMADRNNITAPEGSGGAHSGPAFLPWHREFVKRIELALRLVDPTISLAYIDWTMESALDKSNDSVLFSEYLMGETRGVQIINGPFVGWKTIDGSRNVNRSVGTLAEGKPMTEEHVQTLMARDYLGWFAFPTNQNGCIYEADFNSMEYIHGNGHIYVGGDMSDIPTAAQDPIFFWHHAFIDHLWELWRQRNQTRNEREHEYPEVTLNCANSHHMIGAYMLPFKPYRNNHGLLEAYSNNLVSYADRPTCSQRNPNGCNSDFLFCDLSHGAARCVSKLKKGARCDRYRRENPCFAGECRNGVCVQTERRNPARPLAFGSDYKSKMIVHEMCFNENKCCQNWRNQGYCKSNPWYMSQFCKASCGLCIPKKYTLADDCQDRHTFCLQWKRKGECVKNRNWMQENCRRSCNLCSRTRADECGSGNSNANSNQNNRMRNNDNWNTNLNVNTNSNRNTHNPSRRPSLNPTNRLPSHRQTIPNSVPPGTKTLSVTETCFNENPCCSFWASSGLCSIYIQPMAQDCQVSCNYCIPRSYYHGSCADYHPYCLFWSNFKECDTNTWMSENCRKSCGTCTTISVLQALCQGPSSPLAPAIKWAKSQKHGQTSTTTSGNRWWGTQNYGVSNANFQNDGRNYGYQNSYSKLPFQSTNSYWVQASQWDVSNKAKRIY